MNKPTHDRNASVTVKENRWLTTFRKGDKVIKEVFGRTRQDAEENAAYWINTGMIDDSGNNA